jgi:hypothetical protein
MIRVKRHTPEPWVIAEVERHRRSESHRADRPSLELPLPPPPRQDAPGTGTGRTAARSRRRTVLASGIEVAPSRTWELDRPLLGASRLDESMWM